MGPRPVPKMTVLEALHGCGEVISDGLATQTALADDVEENVNRVGYRLFQPGHPDNPIVVFRPARGGNWDVRVRRQRDFGRTRRLGEPYTADRDLSPVLPHGRALLPRRRRQPELRQRDVVVQSLEHDFHATLLRRRSLTSNDRHKQPRSTLTGDFMSTSNTISKIGAVCSKRTHGYCC